MIKKYKVRLNCVCFVDVVVEANNKKEAEQEAQRVAPNCPQGGLEFGEFLEVDQWDEVEN